MKTLPSSRAIWISRSVFMFALIGGITYKDTIQYWINVAYSFLLKQHWFQSVYFETIWVPVASTFIYAIPFLMDRLNIASSFKLDPSLQWVDAGIKGILLETVEYCLPLIILDTVKAKSYPGVDPEEFAAKSSDWILKQRALPISPPSAFEICYQIIGALILFDAGFQQIHMLLHKNQWLYKHLHTFHHQHNQVHTRVTNQLHVVERISHILVANAGLKAVGAHPFTRVIYVPVFVAWLMYNHSGYEFPFMPEFLLPFNIASGSRKHRAHHMQGLEHYAPFFTHMDRIVKWKKL